MAHLPLRVPHAGGALALDLSASDRFLVVLAGNVSALSVSHITPGVLYRITVMQDSAGGHVLSVGSLTAGTPEPNIDLAPKAVTSLQLRQRVGVTKIWRNNSPAEQPEAIALALEGIVGGAFPEYPTIADLGVAVDTHVPTYPNQTANVVFAGPSAGGAAAPAFRALASADIPPIIDGGAF